MNFRLAEEQDLENVKAVFREIVADMDANGICIWDEVYPCAFFADDIQQRRLYILLDGDKIASAFALCETNSGEPHVKWKESAARVMYIDRFGVNVHCRHRGIAADMLRRAAKLAREKGADALRLFVVDENTPAIRLYEKCGFTRAEGVYREEIDADFVLNEYGYEMPI